MVVSRGLLRLTRLRLCVLGLNGRDDLRNPCKAFHAFELPLAVEQHRPQPPLEHRAPTRTLDVALTVSDQREHALDRVGRHQRLAQQRGHLQSM